MVSLAHAHGATRAALLALALLALAGCGRKPDALADCRLPPDATVLAIGDSLTRGYGAGGEGYAEQLQQRLADAPGRGGVRVVNLGIDGERSEGLLARLDGALAEHRPAVVIVTSGGNDFLRRVSAEQTRRNLREAVARIRAAGAQPLLFAIPEPSLAAAAGIASSHALYAEIAEDGAAHVIDAVVAEVLADEALKSDRIHPNRAGYARMAGAAFAALERCR